VNTMTYVIRRGEFFGVPQVLWAIMVLLLQLLDCIRESYQRNISTGSN
jgi:hypothetical protein